ncbi:TauD/TfdA dioxygenase family protein [Paenibacillus spongiae]|uniref:TauD/TfdA family dioxygenase n=1 Tax=Paenibacillus spongiae TaxID=2909671 RepID=A0ABY5SFS4_9BACL|nr:TauD/TfdA family dioxygenase [Paenibacillus spongiae]UVI32842.1 TauD/TfdA family dioxygenase [Paenibacillus spongiae]
MSEKNVYNDTDKGIEIHPIAGRIGAEISGVRLSADLEESELAIIREAILKYKVVFFRAQSHLDDAGQEAFASLLGEPVPHPTVYSKKGSQYLLELDSSRGGGTNSWHTDVTFDVAYPKYSILRGVVIPAAGGDTVWANTAAAYQNLPAELRSLVDRLWALHTNDFDYAARHNLEETDKDPARYQDGGFVSSVIEAEHPLVRVHPETGERTLVLGHFVKKIIGLSSVDSAQLFSLLQNHITQIENTVRWRWSVGDVAIWDNRATQHYGVLDYGDQHRVVRRVTINGEVPVSVDGRQSVHVRKVKPDHVTNAS